MAPAKAVAGPSKPRAHQSVNAPAVSAPPRPALSAFSPSRTLFALAHPALGQADKVSVWDVLEDRFVSEWEIEGASKATSITFATVPFPLSDAAAAPARSNKKRRKESVAQESAHTAEEVVIVTTAKGQIFVWSPTRGVLSRIDLPVSASGSGSGGPALASASAFSEHGAVLVSATSIYLLSPDLASVAATIALPPRTPAPTAVAVLATSTAEVLHVVIASSSALVLHVTPTGTEVEAMSAPVPVSTSSTIALYPLPSAAEEEPASFVVVSEDDRTVAQYTIPQPGSDPRLSYRYTSPTLSSAHSVSSSASHLSVLHASGQISLFPLPSPGSLDLVRPQSNGKPHAINLVEGKADKPARVCRACIASAAADGADSVQILAGRMLGGGRLKWVSVPIDAAAANTAGKTKVKCDAQDLVSATGKEGKLQRYVAPSTTADGIAASANTDGDEGDDEHAANAALPADVDMADASLGERLLALPSAPGANAVSSNGDVDGTDKGTSKKVALPIIDGPVNAGSLTRLLVQALHTSDPALLSLCLNQRDATLIRNTIRKLPTQLSLPLLKACVERLGQGKRTNSRGGTRGVAQNEQQGRGTVEWVKGVLVERGAVLMTMPSLPAHLSALSKLLDQRLQLYSPLLQLSGRLDLALAQIQMRKVGLDAQRERDGGRAKGKGEKYVEGESDSSEDEESDDDVEVEVDHDDGDAEDVNMLNGGSDESEDDDEEEEGDDDDDDDDDSEDEDPLESDDEDGLDLEADESDDEDEESDED